MADLTAVIEGLGPIGWSALSFFLGLLIGHRLQLGLARRAERQSALVPIRAWVIRQLSQRGYPAGTPSIHELDAYLSRISASKQKRLLNAKRTLLQSFNERQTALGDITYQIEENRREQALRELMDLTKPE